MSEHPINGLMETTMQKIKEMVDVNTIIGDPITTPDGTTVIPVSKVSYGFAAGGGDFPAKKEGKDCFGGGSGAGVSISPIGFLVVSGEEVRFINMESCDGSFDRVINMVPEVIDKVSSLFKKEKKPAADDDIKIEDPRI